MRPFNLVPKDPWRHPSGHGAFRLCVTAANGQRVSFAVDSAAAAFRRAWGVIFRPRIEGDELVGGRRYQNGGAVYPWMRRLAGELRARIFDGERAMSGEELTRLDAESLARGKGMRTETSARLARLDADLARIRPAEIVPLDLGDDE